MNIKNSINKRINKIFKSRKVKEPGNIIINQFNTNYKKDVLISYIISPFKNQNDFLHQNYFTAHLVAENFSELGYNVDIVDFNDELIKIDYAKYSVIFGFGYNFERSFYIQEKNIIRILFVTGAHEVLQNEMSLRSVTDFYNLSGLWVPNEAKVISNSTYYAMNASDITIILAEGFVFEDFKSRYKNKLYSLNNNIIKAFTEFKRKTIEERNNNFLYLSGARQLTKGLHILLEVARTRKHINFFIILPSLEKEIEDYYQDLLNNSSNIFFIKNLRMDSDKMREIIECCTYSVAPSYIDGLPGGTIEPMSAGLIPIVSKYCGFANQEFIFELEDLTIDALNSTINKVLGLSDTDYLKYADRVREYTNQNFSISSVKQSLKSILKQSI